MVHIQKSGYPIKKVMGLYYHIKLYYHGGYSILSRYKLIYRKYLSYLPGRILAVPTFQPFPGRRARAVGYQLQRPSDQPVGERPGAELAAQK